MEGAFTKTTWTTKGVATLVACLTALKAWGDNEKICEAIRYRLKKERRNQRALNSNNPYLVTIHCCHLGDPTPAQRREFSRFSKVIEVAYSQDVRPEEAETWLKDRTQAAILEEARELRGKGSTPKRIVLASKITRPFLWNAVKVGKGKAYEYAMKQLDALENRLANDLKPPSVAETRD